MDNDWLEDDGGADTKQYERRMWERSLGQMEEKHKNAGFKEAVSDAKDRSLQAGFNQGFAAGSAAGYFWGQLHGFLTLLSTHGASSLSAAQQTELQSLLHELDSRMASKDFPPYDRSPATNPTLSAAMEATRRVTQEKSPKTDKAEKAPDSGCCGSKDSTGDWGAGGKKKAEGGCCKGEGKKNEGGCCKEKKEGEKEVTENEREAALRARSVAFLRSAGFGDVVSE